MIDLSPPLSPTIAALTRWAGGDVRRAIARVGEMGFRSVQLSAAQKGLRPRELGRSGRRDLLAFLARHSLMLGGLDLMIPHDHWLDPARQDRAVGSALAALDLAAELGRVPLAMSLPVERLEGAVGRELAAAADGRGTVLAVHAEHDPEHLAGFLERHDHPALGAALDPAAVLAEKRDPAEAALRFAGRLVLARLDDHAPTSVATAGGRCPVGAGRLDLPAYRAALAACRRLRTLVVELRDLADPAAALEAAASAWGRDDLAVR